MRLYTFRHSPNPLKVRFALAELGLEYESVEVNLFQGEQRAPDFLSINPFHKIPVFDDKELRLRESNAILTYLGREYGEKLWPKKPVDEARAVQWLFFEGSQLVRDCGTLWWTDHIAPFARRPGSAELLLHAASENLEGLLEIVESQITEDFVMGEFSLVDCSLGVTLNSLQGTRFKTTKWPKIEEYCARIRARPAWKQADGDGIYPSKFSG